MSAMHEQLLMRRLLDVGRSLMAQMDQHTILRIVLDTAREITSARYAALGILDEGRTELTEFLTVGVDDEIRSSIGSLPRGRGVLGVLIERPEPLRLADVSEHPHSYGFPAGHPVMKSFLGVPVIIRGRAWGNLYLTEKQDGEFSEADEQAATILAEWAGIAVENARLYRTSEQRRLELERALRGLEATRDIAIAIGSDVELEHTLELIAKRGRALVGARSLVIMLRDGNDMVRAAAAGYASNALGTRVPLADSLSGFVLRSGRPERLTEIASRLRIDEHEFGIPDPGTALLVPMVYRGERLGVLAAFDRGPTDTGFSEDDEELLHTFAVSAATAVSIAQSVRSERLHASLAAADAERARWARELHDETLQGLGGLRVLLSSALRRDEQPIIERATRDAVVQIEREIDNLRAIITELRPAALDELGLKSAIEALLDRYHAQTGAEVDRELALLDTSSVGGELSPELQTTIYRTVQEALTNVAKHAQATRVRVAIRQYATELRIEVQDDGVGFDSEECDSGFGIVGMRERVALVGGSLTISSSNEGTLVCAIFSTRPARGGLWLGESQRERGLRSQAR